MEVNFKDIFDKTSDLNPLKISFKDGSDYFQNFKSIFDDIQENMKDEDLKDILFHKLQLGKDTFNEKQYYQSATELCVIYHIYCLNKEKFSYEKVVRDDVDPKNGKQPECSVETNEGFIINAEAKCPERTQNQSPKNGFKGIIFGTFGRADIKADADKLFNIVKNDIETNNSDVEVLAKKNDDNKLKDYLCSAGEKFSSNTNKNEVNILFVSLNTVYEIQEYVDFLCYNKGLFTNDSFADIEEYKNVDMIVFTNSYFRQKNHNNINGNAWSLNDGFNYLTCNPYADLEAKKGALSFFASTIINYNNRIESYTVPATIETPQDLLDSIKIISFVKQELEKNNHTFLFQKQ